MLDDIDIMRQMYAALCGGVDDALTLLENGNIWKAKETLQYAMYRAEELYMAGEQAADELAERRKNDRGF